MASNGEQRSGGIGDVVREAAPAVLWLLAASVSFASLLAVIQTIDLGDTGAFAAGPFGGLAGGGGDVSLHDRLLFFSQAIGPMIIPAVGGLLLGATVAGEARVRAQTAALTVAVALLALGTAYSTISGMVDAEPTMLNVAFTGDSDGQILLRGLAQLGLHAAFLVLGTRLLDATRVGATAATPSGDLGADVG